MVQIIKIGVLLVLILEVQSDLIGYNRLGNNVQNHSRFRGGATKEYQLSNLQSILYNTAMTLDEKHELLKLLNNNTPSNGRNHSRKRFFNRKPSTAGVRQGRNKRRLAYTRRMRQ